MPYDTLRRSDSHVAFSVLPWAKWMGSKLRTPLPWFPCLFLLLALLGASCLSTSSTTSQVGSMTLWNQQPKAQEELIMPKLPLAATAVASVLLTLATGSVAQTVPPDLPLAIICFNDKTQTWAVGYLHVVNEDASATYVAPAGGLSATVNAKGLVQPPSDRPAGVDCFGKTLKELRAAGRVMDTQ